MIFNHLHSHLHDRIRDKMIDFIPSLHLAETVKFLYLSTSQVPSHDDSNCPKKKLIKGFGDFQGKFGV